MLIYQLTAKELSGLDNKPVYQAGNKIFCPCCKTYSYYINNEEAEKLQCINCNCFIPYRYIRHIMEYHRSYEGAFYNDGDKIVIKTVKSTANAYNGKLSFKKISYRYVINVISGRSYALPGLINDDMTKKEGFIKNITYDDVIRLNRKTIIETGKVIEKRKRELMPEANIIPFEEYIENNTNNHINGIGILTYYNANPCIYKQSVFRFKSREFISPLKKITFPQDLSEDSIKFYLRNMSDDLANNEELYKLAYATYKRNIYHSTHYLNTCYYLNKIFNNDKIVYELIKIMIRDNKLINNILMEYCIYVLLKKHHSIYGENCTKDLIKDIISSKNKYKYYIDYIKEKIPMIYKPKIRAKEEDFYRELQAAAFSAELKGWYRKRIEDKIKTVRKNKSIEITQLTTKDNIIKTFLENKLNLLLYKVNYSTENCFLNVKIKEKNKEPIYALYLVYQYNKNKSDDTFSKCSGSSLIIPSVMEGVYTFIVKKMKDVFKYKRNIGTEVHLIAISGCRNSNGAIAKATLLKIQLEK